ncbi:MAG: saccharopine dehydrogenase C-terminal domain-containing protein [Gammaproteobacteria bacterium]|nr:MAG: saccharopine dehydrogenase C-terminal domain-containing protein [Gammaproteobacteria bacterium]
MHRVLVLGSGKIGSLISGLLAGSGDYEVDLADSRPGAAREVATAHGLPAIRPLDLDATDRQALERHAAAHGIGALVSALPYHCNQGVAEAARATDCHYFDLTEDLSVAATVQRVAAGAATAFAPQCGLAPGFVSIAAAELIRHFASLRTVKLRVGALPQHPNNVLKYSLTWSTDGLINEYGNPCIAVVDQQQREVLPLEGREEIEIDGQLYEAFNTSGGLGSLAASFGAQVESMDYKTIRYPGHCAQMHLLMSGLKLNQDRATLKRILENAVPQTLQDVVIIYVAVTGMQDGEFREENYVNKVYPQLIAGRLWSAIQVTTAAGLCAVIDLVFGTPGRFRGFVRQEDLPLAEVLANRFGRYFDGSSGKDVSLRVVTAGQAGHQRSHGKP